MTRKVDVEISIFNADTTLMLHDQNKTANNLVSRVSHVTGGDKMKDPRNRIGQPKTICLATRT